MKQIRMTGTALVAALTLAVNAQTARLGSLPGDTMVVTNTSALELTQAMLDAINATNAATLQAAQEMIAALNMTNAAALNAFSATNAALIADILSRTNGWAQYDTLVQQSNATVRLYQSETSLRWAWLTPTNMAVTTLTPDPSLTFTNWASANFVWSQESDKAPLADATLYAAHGGGAVIACRTVAGEQMRHELAISLAPWVWTTGTIAYAADAYQTYSPESVAWSVGTSAELFAGFFNSAFLWRSSDGGATWDIVDTLPVRDDSWFGHIFVRGDEIIAVPFSSERFGLYRDTFAEHCTNRWMRSTDDGYSWLAFDIDYVYQNPSAPPTQMDFIAYASYFANLHQTEDGEIINLCTWVSSRHNMIPFLNLLDKRF
ncbi:MAG TPA: hypothetical protein P5026_10785, partial [Kiritimatiellia bacterium]|nr:hypothetical protein [Kiritimatiellia bacterium]HRU71384.1 hypothetical protein [Kiritimatiellia bacterium]